MTLPYVLAKHQLRRVNAVMAGVATPDRP
jgi:hypothetical protein